MTEAAVRARLALAGVAMNLGDVNGDGRTDGVDGDLSGLSGGPFGYLKAVVRDAGISAPPIDVTPRAKVSATAGLPPYATATPMMARGAGIYLPALYKGEDAQSAALLAGGSVRVRSAMVASYVLAQVCQLHSYSDTLELPTGNGWGTPPLYRQAQPIAPTSRH